MASYEQVMCHEENVESIHENNVVLSSFGPNRSVAASHEKNNVSLLSVVARDGGDRAMDGWWMRSGSGSPIPAHGSRQRGKQGGDELGQPPLFFLLLKRRHGAMHAMQASGPPIFRPDPPLLRALRISPAA
ncbi:hypothetical protein ZWY2020_013689 [Hordeum vulgare]|nr:hypothetical protein ZWY2020_013689 [Hordeum vulgare]